MQLPLVSAFVIKYPHTPAAILNWMLVFPQKVYVSYETEDLYEKLLLSPKLSKSLFNKQIKYLLSPNKDIFTPSYFSRGDGRWEKWILSAATNDLLETDTIDAIVEYATSEKTFAYRLFAFQTLFERGVLTDEQIQTYVLAAPVELGSYPNLPTRFLDLIIETQPMRSV